MTKNKATLLRISNLKTKAIRDMTAIIGQIKTGKSIAQVNKKLIERYKAFTSTEYKTAIQGIESKTDHTFCFLVEEHPKKVPYSIGECETQEVMNQIISAIDDFMWYAQTIYTDEMDSLRMGIPHTTFQMPDEE